MLKSKGSPAPVTLPAPTLAEILAALAVLDRAYAAGWNGRLPCSNPSLFPNAPPAELAPALVTFTAHNGHTYDCPAASRHTGTGAGLTPCLECRRRPPVAAVPAVYEGPARFAELTTGAGTVAGERYPFAKYGRSCGQAKETGGRRDARMWVCTRPHNHEGPHVAHIGDGTAAAWWPR